METTTTPNTRVPASSSYGKACVNCAKSKSRCISDSDSADPRCERCRRIDKECVPQATVRKRATAKKTITSKSAELEKKLDNLANLLKLATQAAPLTVEQREQVSAGSQSLLNPSTSAGELDSTTVPIPQIEVNDIELSRKDCLGSSQTPLQAPTPACSCDGSNPSYSYDNTMRSTSDHGLSLRFQTLLSSQSELSAVEAEACLTAFRRQVDRFPFLVIPSMTALELREERPFFWKAIIAVSAKNTERQWAYAQEVKYLAGQKIVNEGFRTMDLLYGLLTYVVWGHYHLHNGRVVLTPFVQLAKSLIYDMALNKPIYKKPFVFMNYTAKGCPRFATSQTRTSEERRLVLGCYLISSIMSGYFQKVEPLRWSSYLEECTQWLNNEHEHPNDALLIQFVRLQQIAQKVDEAPWGEHYQESEDLFTTKPPASHYLKALQTQIKTLKTNIPVGLKDNLALRLAIYNVDAVIHQVGVSKAPLSLDDNVRFQRLECLYACLNAVKSWFDLFISVPAAMYIEFSLPVYVQLAHGVILLYQLSTFDDPDWDVRNARETANLLGYLQKIVDKMEKIKAEADLDGDVVDAVDLYSQMSIKFGSIKTWWDAKLTIHSLRPPHVTPLNDIIIDDPRGALLDQAPMMLDMNMTDDQWLKELLGTWDCVDENTAASYF